MKIGLVSLGCDKNRVDAEKMLSRLSDAGYDITEDGEEADVLIVNTCAFIESAKKEAIDNILAAAEIKKRKGTKLVVTGCFATRYLEETKAGFPEADAVLPVKEEDKIVETVNALVGEKRFAPAKEGRILTTPPWYAYLKIADGCDNRCTYCAIPAIRGKYVSEPMEKLVEEASLLAERGVKELILVAQDTTNYGVDLYGEKRLVPLLRELCKLPFWKVRLLYAYPDRIDDELLAFIDGEPKMAKYLDIPMQHASNAVLKHMGRKNTYEDAVRLMKKIRSLKNYVAVRSSFIVGFPGETDEDAECLTRFAADNVDYAGFFAYSREDGTPAYKLPGQILSSVKKKRKTAAEKAFNAGLIEKQKRLLGKTVEVICDGIDEVKGMFFGRTEYQTPEVDTLFYFTADFTVAQGAVFKVKVTEVGFHLKGFASKEENAI